LFMGLGPLVAALGMALLLTLPARLDYATDLLPPLVIFSLGLTATVAPLTATVLGDADESNAGIASGINNAIARMASLLAIAAVGGLLGLAGIRNPRRAVRCEECPGGQFVGQPADVARERLPAVAAAR